MSHAGSSLGTELLVRAARADELAPVLALLESASLPVAGVRESFGDFLVADSGGCLVGAIGLERYGDSVLLRSAAVAAGWRGRGVGRALVSELLARAADAGAREIYLLTETAEAYFARLGFERIAREAVPTAVRESVEFREACPASAAVLRKRLEAAA